MFIPLLFFSSCQINIVLLLVADIVLYIKRCCGFVMTNIPYSINIDEPGNVVWRQTQGHQAGNAEHGKAWNDFFKKNPHPTKEQVLQRS